MGLPGSKKKGPAHIERQAKPPAAGRTKPVQNYEVG
jgi:hypothetical protein